MTNREQNIELLKTRLMQNGIFKQFQCYLQNTDDEVDLYFRYNFLRNTVEEVSGDSSYNLTLDDDPKLMKQLIDHVLDDMYIAMH